MCKILIAFYNGLLNYNRIPPFYESFCNNVKMAGNDVYIAQHSRFGVDFGQIPIEQKEEIIRFAPDLCIVFNNSFYDLSFLNCKILILETDSPLYFSNQNTILKNPHRYIFVVAQTTSIDVIKKRYGNGCSVYRIPYFSEIKNNNVKQNINISFIGTRFDIVAESKRYRTIVKDYSDEDIYNYLSILKYLENNPFVSNEELKIAFGNNQSMIERIDIATTLHMISGERRIKVLSQLTDLGLELYGTRNWLDTYYYDTDIARCYKTKVVSTINENQDIYNRSKISISVSHVQAQSGYPWRVMDIMASNSVLVSDYHSDYHRDFGEDVFPIYHDAYEARQICTEILADEKYRKKVVKRCNEIIDSEYRFENYISRLENIVGMPLKN